MDNAAPEWQAESLGWRRRKWREACPLEGLVMQQSELRVSYAYTSSMVALPHSSSGKTPIQKPGRVPHPDSSTSAA